MKNRTILITGGTGSWGQELVRKLLEKSPKEIRIFSRNESLQAEMKQLLRHHPALTFIIGDIRDQDELMQACQQVDIIYHLAALKHVPVCEQQPDQAFKTNVMGTQHVIQAAIQNQVNKVIYVSTDKASHPANTYGMTKALGEKLMIHANVREGDTQFVCVRSGNVLGSAGSVVPIFRQRIEQGLELGLTDARMSRFFLTVGEAIELLLKATDDSHGGEIFVTKMPACHIKDLAQVLIEDLATSTISICETGVRPGERLNEILISEFESRYAIDLDEHYYVILPSFEIAGLQDYYSGCPAVTMKSYDSEHATMSQEEIREMLHRGGLLA